MAYALTLTIDENSAADRNIESIARAEHLSREEAALKLIAKETQSTAAGPRARRILGAFKDDADLMDEVVDLAMEDRPRRNAAPPNV